MFLYSESGELLRVLGKRVMSARLERGDTQAAFAYRLGVSIPTLRDLEAGRPTVALGVFVSALEVVGRLHDLGQVLSGVSTDRRRSVGTRLKVSP